MQLAVGLELISITT